MLSVGSNRRVVDFSNRFINLGVSVLLKWSRSSCHAFGPSPFESFVSIRTLQLSRQCTKYAQILYFLSFVPASVPFSTFSSFFVNQNPSNHSCYTAKSSPLPENWRYCKGRSIPHKLKTKARNRQKEVTETKMGQQNRKSHEDKLQS